LRQEIAKEEPIPTPDWIQAKVTPRRIIQKTIGKGE